MPNDIFSYDESVADTSHGDIGTVAQGIQSGLDDLTGFVTQVLANWEGDEMELYQGIQRRWDTAAATVSEILRSVQTALGETTSSVQEMRGQVRGALQG